MSAAAALPDEVAGALQRGLVIPAHPLALDAARRFDERRQRALTRYYHAAGAGGVAVGVHTTQFAIRDPAHALLRPVLALCRETVAACDAQSGRRTVCIAGVCGDTAQAIAEAALARDLGYDLGLLSLAALRDAGDDALIEHTRAVAEVLPVFGFYLQPAVGGRELGREFWRRFAGLEGVAAIKVAPFDRYHTLDVLLGVAQSGRADRIALYTGNDDNIVHDLSTVFHLEGSTLKFAGGLLGHWAVWTRRAVEQLAAIHAGQDLGGRAAAITDCNAAFFDARHRFHGCIAGIHEVLRRQGLLEGTWCLDPDEGLSPGQSEEIDRVYAAYPDLHDDAFVAEHRDAWLA